MSSPDTNNLLDSETLSVEGEFWAAAQGRVDAKTVTVWTPQEGPQKELIKHLDTFEVMLGGARGGGKTDGCLGDWIFHERKYGKHARGMFLRREAINLEDAIQRSQELYPGLGATWNGTRKNWTFPSGATLAFRHLWDDAAASRYQGFNLTRIYAEELTQWATPDAINKLKATLRSAHGVAVGFRATANPGNAGHGWVKARYIDPAPEGRVPIVDPDTNQIRIFLPSRLEDNKALTESDPSYEARLMQSGPDYLVRAWRWGDWNIVAGGYFDDVFDYESHVYEPFPIPRSWTLRRAFDWGSAKPSSFGIFAVSDGTFSDRGGVYLPPGSLIMIDEWYTAKTKNGMIVPDQGLRLSNQELGMGIAQRSMGTALECAEINRDGSRNILPYSGCVADPAIFTTQGGPSIYDQIKSSALMSNHRLHFTRADNSRVAGWQKMRDMMRAAKDGDLESPWLCVFDRCLNFIRTVPVLPRDEKNPDDLLTSSEDHAADMTRYCVMSGNRSVRTTTFEI